MEIYSTIRSALWLAAGYPADEYARVLDKSEHWSRQELESYRDEKLRRLIAHCYMNVPYYREVMEKSRLRPQDIKSAEDLVKLPLLTKEIVRNHAKELTAKNIGSLKITWSKTGGTTGEPLHIPKNKECDAWSSMCYERGLTWGGLKVHEPRISLFGGSLGIDKTGFRSRVGSIIRRDLFLPAFELRADTAASYFDKIRDSRCRYLLGYASAIYRLAVLAEEMGRKVSFDAVFPTAELLLPEWEQTIRKVFNCRVLPYYGCGEVNSLGYSRSETNSYFIPEEHALIEIFRDRDSITLSGEGRFVITDLDNYAMPIIRYVNGDAGKIAPASAQLPFSRIESLDGRYNSFLMTDKGDLISGAMGAHVFRHLPSVQRYRIVQEEPLRIVVRVVPNANFSEENERFIERLFRDHLGQRMHIAVEKVSDLPISRSGKSVFVVNKCLENPIGYSD